MDFIKRRIKYIFTAVFLLSITAGLGMAVHAATDDRYIYDESSNTTTRTITETMDDGTIIETDYTWTTGNTTWNPNVELTDYNSGRGNGEHYGSISSEGDNRDLINQYANTALSEAEKKALYEKTMDDMINGNVGSSSGNGSTKAKVEQRSGEYLKELAEKNGGVSAVSSVKQGVATVNSARNQNGDMVYYEDNNVVDYITVTYANGLTTNLKMPCGNELLMPGDKPNISVSITRVVITPTKSTPASGDEDEDDGDCEEDDEDCDNDDEDDDPTLPSPSTTSTTTEDGCTDSLSYSLLSRYEVGRTTYPTDQVPYNSGKNEGRMGAVNFSKTAPMGGGIWAKLAWAKPGDNVSWMAEMNRGTPGVFGHDSGHGIVFMPDVTNCYLSAPFFLEGGIQTSYDPSSSINSSAYGDESFFGPALNAPSWDSANQGFCGGGLGKDTYK